jgi:hypothetical protein
MAGQKPANFRLNFFVDEVGQYIAENTKLMTNLQTVAESLATKCQGRAWIIVTAQEDMNSVLGDMSKQQSNDFSKIQARFANRLKLTSADVAEVIQKRLLTKNEIGTELAEDDLQPAGQQLQDAIRVLPTAGSQYQNFRDEAHFIYCLPVRAVSVSAVPVGHSRHLGAQRLRGQGQLSRRALHAGRIPRSGHRDR